MRPVYRFYSQVYHAFGVLISMVRSAECLPEHDPTPGQPAEIRVRSEFDVGTRLVGREVSARVHAHGIACPGSCADIAGFALSAGVEAHGGFGEFTVSVDHDLDIFTGTRADSCTHCGRFQGMPGPDGECALAADEIPIIGGSASRSDLTLDPARPGNG